MQYAKIFLGIIISIYCLIIFITMLKSKRFTKTLFLSILQGICSLFAVNLLGQYISVHIPINCWTLGISSIGGLPSVIMILLCDVFFI